MGEVVFRLRADQAQAAQQFLSLVDAQKKTEGAFKNSVNSATKFDKALGGIKRSILGVAGGFLGAQGILMGVGKLREELREANESTKRFEQTITGLLSLGDNVQNFANIKGEVRLLSGAFAETNESIASSMFTIQSASADLSQTIRDDLLKESLKLKQVTGTELPVAVEALVTSYLIYGDQIKDINKIEAIMFKTAADGKLEFSDLAKLLPQVAGAAKPLGISFEEINGALLVASQRSGDLESTFTSMRNILLRMNDAVDAGIVSQGSLIEQLEEMRNVEPDALEKVFGERTFSTISNLIDDVGKVKIAVEDLQNVSFADSALARDMERFKDSTFAAVEALRAAEETLKQKKEAQTQGTVDAQLREKARRLAIEEQVGSGIVGRGLSYVGAKVARFGDAADKTLGRESMDDWRIQRGAAIMKEQAIDAGDTDRARIIERTVLGGGEQGAALANIISDQRKAAEPVQSADEFFGPAAAKQSRTVTADELERNRMRFQVKQFDPAIESFEKPIKAREFAISQAEQKARQLPEGGLQRKTLERDIEGQREELEIIKGRRELLEKEKEILKMKIDERNQALKAAQSESSRVGQTAGMSTAGAM